MKFLEYEIKEEKNQYVVSDLDRSFTIDKKTLEPSQDWFVSHMDMMSILSMIQAENKLNG